MLFIYDQKILGPFVSFHESILPYFGIDQIKFYPIEVIFIAEILYHLLANKTRKTQILISKKNQI